MLELKVSEAPSEDVGRGIVRIDPEHMAKLELEAGDVVKIISDGIAFAVAKVLPTRPQDRGKWIIQMDGVLRSNAKARIDGFVKLEKADCNPAQFVRLSPLTLSPMAQSRDGNYIKKLLLNIPMKQGDRVRANLFGAGFQTFEVLSTKPSGIVMITPDTFVEIQGQPIAKEEGKERRGVSYEDVGGLKQQLDRIREMIELPLKYPQLFEQLGIDPPKGVLLYGAPGTGKTLIARALANETDAYFTSIAGPEIMCVGGKTPIVTQQGVLKAEEIFQKAREQGKLIRESRTLEAYELVCPIKIPAFDAETLQLREGEIIRALRLRVPRSLRIRINGEDLVVSENQPFATLDGHGRPLWKKASELKVGERVITIAYLRKPPKGKRQIEWLDRLDEHHVFAKKILGYFEQKAPDDVSVQELKKLLEAPLRFEKVEAVKEADEAVLYDFEVKPYANFIAGANLIVLHNSMFYGQSEANLRRVFNEAKRNQPAIIFIDEIDAICPKRAEVIGEVEKRVVSQLLALMDGLEPREQIVVIAATNIPEVLDPALRRPGRFDREIVIPIPDEKGRLQILEIHTRGMPLAQDVDLKKLAEITHGFVGADLAALCREAAMRALRRILPDLDLESGSIPYETIFNLKVERRDFEEALKEIEPSAMREIFVEIPNVSWQDVGGLHEIKERLKQAIEWPLKHRDAFEKLKVRPPKGILIYGPPGTGKTLLAKAVANECGVNFISIKGPEILSKWLGESEKKIRELFRKARQAAPCIIFIDELDALATERGRSMGSDVYDRVTSQLLTELDGIEPLQGVIVIGATNRKDLVDEALLRPGRLELQLETKIPDLVERVEIFKVHTRKMPLAEDVDFEDLALDTEGLNGADIEFICREAAMNKIRAYVESKGQLKLEELKLTQDDLLKIIELLRKKKRAEGHEPEP